jgi:hypothetical protein
MALTVFAFASTQRKIESPVPFRELCQVHAALKIVAAADGINFGGDFEAVQR